jgi:hypothetical protein
MRKALVVGIDYYANTTSLFGCVSDAIALRGVLERHSDGSVNFSVRLIASTDLSSIVSRAKLRDLIGELFDGESDIALLYFAGHGSIDSVGGYLLASDGANVNDGVPISEIVSLANKCRSNNRIIILDSCHSGIAGAHPLRPDASELTEGMTILTASTSDQYAEETNGSGVFTSLLVDGLNGAAGNLVGDITPGAVYAHIDQSLGPWEQRPVFKTNVKNFVSIRKVQAPIELSDLRRISSLFPEPGFQLQLNPTFEPERSPGMGSEIPAPDPTNTHTFRILQRYNRVNLVVPVDAPHMWHAAMESRTCKLTALGEHYRRLVLLGRL